MREIEDRALLEYNQPHTRTQEEHDSARVFREIANQALPKSVKMVEDVPGNHPSGFLPILDTQMVVSVGKFLFKHFTKPVASVEVTLQRTAMSGSSKLNILTNEGFRRLRNCSLDTPWTEQVLLLNKLMVSMMGGRLLR